ncbi:SCO family protein [Actinomycetospora sp. TBRC 11914]|uniref:SCO family protein n=1 Tax=Actinomycetospora sp. TBRC 11914 TaxID=2729387 RepID=UPI00145C6AC9|nr:SCO family protein [Actinomycetospora sp. TBRC 11914]NMO91340.1 SCO family protein [Actinomycetospora sp. TBRC 11914]
MSAPTDVAFSLVDHDGRPVDAGSWPGRWLLVQFGFTSCRVVCPRALTKLTEALDALGPAVADRVRPLYVSVDPERDTPEVMRAFLTASYPCFTGLTGTPVQVEAAKQAFRVFARRRPDPEDPDGYAVPHTAITYLVDPGGHLARHWPDTADAPTLAADLTAVVEGGRVSPTAPS